MTPPPFPNPFQIVLCSTVGQLADRIAAHTARGDRILGVEWGTDDGGSTWEGIGAFALSIGRDYVGRVSTPERLLRELGALRAARERGAEGNFALLCGRGSMGPEGDLIDTEGDLRVGDIGPFDAAFITLPGWGPGGEEGGFALFLSFEPE